jgi:hypothetical protein
MAGLRRFAEQTTPYLVAVPVALRAWKHPPLIPEGYHADVIGSSLTMAAIFLGFMATSLSILISIKETPVALKLREHNSWSQLVSYLRQAIFWTLLWLISSFLLYFLKPSLLLAVWSILATLALMCFLRVVYLLSKLIL